MARVRLFPACRTPVAPSALAFDSAVSSSMSARRRRNQRQPGRRRGLFNLLPLRAWSVTGGVCIGLPTGEATFKP